MTMYGAGSLGSPIVISDDEDEVNVELELEQRLSSPREGMDFDFETFETDDEASDGNYDLPQPAVIDFDDLYSGPSRSSYTEDDLTPDGRFTPGTPCSQF